jgi:tRNA pseudouridine13 synthase
MQRSDNQLENTIGIGFFLTDTPGIGGFLRKRFEDFVVKEVPVEKSENEEGDYTHFTLKKTNWDTIRSISALSKALGVSRKRFGFAGTKDRRAITSQRMAVWNVSPERLRVVKIKDLALTDFKKSDERLLVGDLLGNEFEITVRDPKIKEEAVLRECWKQIVERGVPNYFGYQRFGLIRPNTHLVGRLLLKGDIKGAVMSYLTDYYPGEGDDAREARKGLKETMDFKAALKSFPKRLSYEKTMIDQLHNNPTDFAGAFRRLHKKLRQLFIHGYQSYIFNKILSAMIRNEFEINGREIPLFGYQSTFSQGSQGEIEKRILEEENTSFDEFKIRSLPELSSRGAMRNASLKTDVSWDIGGGDSIQFKFFLSKGNYATMIMREFMKTDPLSY